MISRNSVKVGSPESKIKTQMTISALRLMSGSAWDMLRKVDISDSSAYVGIVGAYLAVHMSDDVIA